MRLASSTPPLFEEQECKRFCRVGIASGQVRAINRLSFAHVDVFFEVQIQVRKAFDRDLADGRDRRGEQTFSAIRKIW